MNVKVENLIKFVNGVLSPEYELVVEDIPEEYINVPQNITKSTKCIELRKINDEEAYVDWYYNAFNEVTLKGECLMMSEIDRDMDATLAYEFKSIGLTLLNALNNK